MIEVHLRIYHAFQLVAITQRGMRRCLKGFLEAMSSLSSRGGLISMWIILMR